MSQTTFLLLLIFPEKIYNDFGAQIYDRRVGKRYLSELITNYINYHK